MAHHVCLDLQLPAVESARRILQDQLEHMELAGQSCLNQDLAVSVTGIHDLRAAIRRSLAALDCFSPWLDKKWSRSYKREFRKLLQQLSRTRDIDIIGQTVSRLTEDVQTDGQEQADAVLAGITRLQERRHKKLAALLQETLTQTLNRQLTNLRTPDATIRMSNVDHNSGKPLQLFRLGDSLPQILFSAGLTLTAWHNTCPSVPGLAKNLPLCNDDIMHQIRISSRYFRYCLEYFTGLPRYKAAAPVAKLQQLQDILGQWHDLKITCRYLQKMMPENPDARCLKICLDEAEKNKQQKAEEFHRIWTQINPEWVYHNLRQTLNGIYRPQN